MGELSVPQLFLFGILASVAQTAVYVWIIWRMTRLTKQTENTNAIVNLLADTSGRPEVKAKLDATFVEVRRRRASDWWRTGLWR
jgi:hypothetical protein